MSAQGRWKWLAIAAMVMGMALMGGCEYDDTTLDGLACGEDEDCPTGASCDDGVCVAQPGVNALSLESQTVVLEVGQTATLSVTVLNEDGEEMDNADLEWVSSDSSVVDVDSASGEMSAASVGTALVTVESGQRSASAAVEVSDVSAATVELEADGSDPTADGLSLEEGTQAPVEATVRDAEGNALSDRFIRWVSSDEDVVQVALRRDGSGLVFGQMEGEATIEVEVGGSVLAEFDVDVTEPSVAAVEVIPGALTMSEGSSLELGSDAGIFAQAFDNRGTELLGREVSWSVAEGSEDYIEIDDAQEWVTAIGPTESGDTAVLEATIEGEVGQTQITVGELEVGSVSISPAGFTLEEAQSEGFSATVRDEEGSELPGEVSNLDWSVSEAGVIDLDDDGSFEALAPGSVTVSAEWGGGQLMDSSYVTVLPKSVDDVVITSYPSTLRPGENESAQVEINGDDIPAPSDKNVEWQLSESGPLTVNPTAEGAEFLAQQPGTVNVTAVVDGVESDPVEVNVGEWVYDDVVMWPQEPSIKEGQALSFSGLVLADDGRSVEDASVEFEVCDGQDPDWDDCDQSLATMDSEDRLMATVDSGGGQVTVRATSSDPETGDTLETTTDVTIEEAPVINVRFEDPIVELVLEETTEGSFDFEVYTINGEVSDVEEDLINFESSDELVFEIDGEPDWDETSVDVVAQAAGNGVLEARADNDWGDDEILGRAFVQVGEPAVKSVTITSAPESLEVGDSAQLEVGVDIAGPTVSAADVQWWVSAPQAASISNDGQLFGLQPEDDVVVTAFYQGEYDTHEFNVSEFSGDITINDEDGDELSGTIDLKKGDSKTVSVDGCPDGVPVRWSSSDSSVVAFDGSGDTVDILAVGIGDSEKTVTATCGGADATLEVDTTVDVDVTLTWADDGDGAQFSSGIDGLLYYGESADIDVDLMVNGESSDLNGCPKDLDWRSDDPDVVAVSKVNSETLRATVIGGAGIEESLDVMLECAGESDNLVVEAAIAPDGGDISVTCEDEDGAECDDSPGGSGNYDFEMPRSGGTLEPTATFESVLSGETQDFEACQWSWEVNVTDGGGVAHINGDGVVSASSDVDEAEFTPTCRGLKVTGVEGPTKTIQFDDD